MSHLPILTCGVLVFVSVIALTAGYGVEKSPGQDKHERFKRDLPMIRLLRKLSGHPFWNEDQSHSRDSSSDQQEPESPVSQSLALVRSLQPTDSWRDSPRYWMLRRLFRRSPTLENFMSVYSNLFYALQRFVPQLMSKLKPGYPDVLKNMPSILFFTPDDASFQSGNSDEVRIKFFYVNDALQIILAKIGQFVNDNDKAWLQSESRMLNYYAKICVLATLSMVVMNDPPPPSMTSGGIGSINTGVQKGISRKDLENMYNLVAFLMQASAQANR